MINPENIDKIRPFVTKYGYYSVFFGVMLENIGIPVPGETILIIGGILAGQQLLAFPNLILVTVIGAVIGDNIGYWIGRKGGRKLLEKYGYYILIREKQLKKVDDYFLKFGNITIFFARFVTGVRVFGAIFAGAARMPWKSFLLYNVSGAIAWALTFGTLGFAFSKSLHTVGTYIFWIEISILILIVLIVYFLWRKKT